MVRPKLYFVLTGILFAVFAAVFQPGAASRAFSGTPQSTGVNDIDQIGIVVNETSMVKGDQITLGDISEIHANGFLKDTLEKVVVDSAPKPDRIKMLDKSKIVSAVNGQRYLPETVSITSPERIYVKRLSQTITLDQVRQFVDPILSRLSMGRDYKVKAFKVRGMEIYPQGHLAFRLDKDDIIDTNGKISCFLDVLIDGKKEDRLSVTGEVAIFESVFHAGRFLKKDEKIGMQDLYSEKTNIFDLGERAVKSMDQIHGKVPKKDVKKGETITFSLLTESPLIKKGDVIKLIARNANLMIVTSGVSKEDGFENEVIRVENLTSGKLVRGIVKDRYKVEVVY